MDIQKIFEGLGLYKPLEPLCFIEQSGMVSYKVGGSFPVGELVCDYANLLLDKREEKRGIISLTKSLADILASPSNKQYEEIYREARKYGNHVFGWTILLLIHESINSGYKAYMSEYFFTILHEISKMCSTYIKGRKLKTGKDGISLDAHIFSDENGQLFIEYSSRSAQAIVFYHLMKLQETGQRPSICKVCGRAFIPVSKSNELYCRKKYADGRTCADIAFLSKEKEDPFYSIYRTAYKTMYARSSRMIGKTSGKKRLEKWRKEAKIKMDEYQTSGDIDGFKKWIEESKRGNNNAAK